MATNGISTTTSTTAIATKVSRRELKLALAASKRATVNIPGYRELHTISGTHIAYVNGENGAQLEELSGSTSPIIGHPWI